MSVAAPREKRERDEHDRGDRDRTHASEELGPEPVAVQPEDVELLAGDELGEQLEVALENGRVDLVRHGPRGYCLGGRRNATVGASPLPAGNRTGGQRRRPADWNRRAFVVSQPVRDDRAGRLLARGSLSLSRPIVGAAAAGAGPSRAR